MSWMYAMAALVSTVAACLEDRPVLAISAGSISIVCVMRAWKSVREYIADHARWQSMSPPPCEAETIAGEGPRTRRIGRIRSTSDNGKGRAA